MTPNLPARIDDLPKSLIDVAETLGMRIALRMITEFGGLELRFPRSPDAAHPIIVALGEDDGFALCNFLDGARIYIPHGQIKSARRAVLDLEQRGLNRADIARELGISQRHVRRVANKMPTTDPRQMPLPLE